MKALITGGAGFIGSHLSEYLLEQGHQVFAVDDLSTGNIENILQLKTHPHFHYTIDTIMNVPVTAELVDRCDVVFHLAAAVGVKLIVESPVRTIETNIKGTEIILELAGKKKKKVLITSTSEVYGKGKNMPFSEDNDLVLGPTHKGRWSYACSKAIDEFLALAYWHEKRLPSVIVRPFNVYGPGMQETDYRVMANFASKILAGEPLRVYGTGKQTRTFCYVTDAIVGFMKVLLRGRPGEAYNIGNPTPEVSMLDLAKALEQAMGRPITVNRVEHPDYYPADEPQRRCPDITKARRQIGFEPAVEFDCGLKRFLGWTDKTYTGDA